MWGFGKALPKYRDADLLLCHAAAGSTWVPG